MIHRVPEAGSTNADLVARLAGGEVVPEGEWLLADRQTAGRGRQGRTWFDGSGNFMGSTVIRPGLSDPPPASLALVIGLALIEAVCSFVPPPQRAMLKWPNDLMIGEAKLAGILLEAVAGAIVAGVGVNLASAPPLPDRPTVALSTFGPIPDRDHFAQELAASLKTELERWRTYGLAPVINRWLALAHPIGTALKVGEPGEEPLHGQFAGLADDGALQLRLADGTTRTIHAGEVRLG